MNFTLIKCFLKLSNVLNENLNLTIILRTFRQKSTQIRHNCNFEEMFLVKKTESLQVLSFLQKNSFSFYWRAGGEDLISAT